MQESDEYIVDFVRLESGKIPFVQFLDKLEKKERAEVLATIEEFRRRRSKGIPIPQSISKHLSESIFELRVHHTHHITRSLYFFSTGKRIIFTHGFIKKTERTPTEEIEKAKRYKMEYKIMMGEI